MAISIKPEYLKRYKDIGTLLWKYGRADLVKSAGLMADAPPSEAVEMSAQPEELANDLEAMGPIYIKLGQVLSSRPDILPIPYIHALVRLQDRVPPFSFAEVEQIVEQELGVRISKAFDQFESTAIASASLGQVHRARLRDGREVAVKVQRPGIREEAEKDTIALKDIADFLDAHTELGRRYHFHEVLDEFSRTLAHELDYRREAHNLALIGGNLRRFEYIEVPRPIIDYTTERVLTMEFVRGTKITELSPLATLSFDGKILADQLFQAYLQQILVDGVFHADPHPGNVFLTEQHKIALIDLGMVGYLRPALQEELLKLLLAISEGKSDEATAIGLKIGPRDLNSEQRFDEGLLRRKVASVLEDRFGATLEQTQIGLAVADFARICAESGVRMPPELTMLAKTLLNLDQIGRTLDPAFNPNEAIHRNAFRLAGERLSKALTPASILTAAIEAKEFTQELPRRVNKILDLISKNELTLQIDAIEEKTLVDGFQKIANRIATGLILAALIIGAAMLMRVDTPFKIFGYPGLAILCFLAAVFGGLWLLVEIVQNDRRMRKV